MTNSLEILKNAIRARGDRFFGEDYIPEDFEIVEEDDWTQDGKYQQCDVIVKDQKGNYFQITNSRSGSYHTDWYYNEADVIAVKRVEKVVTTVVWEAI